MQRLNGLLFLALLTASCHQDTMSTPDVSRGDDATGVTDEDASIVDTGTADSGTLDTSDPDTAAPDTVDEPDPTDTGAADTASPDTGTPDTGTLDTGTPDTGGTGECTPVARPADVPLAPLEGESGEGQHLSVASGGFHDEYLINAGDYTRIGVRREWGGSVVFFGLVGNDASNVIDANDTGREVQVAFYDPDRQMQGCAYDASCASHPTDCPASIRYLGWNPVQGGNRCNNGSGIEGLSYEDNTLSVRVRPLHWNPNWERADCSAEVCGGPGDDLQSDVEVNQSMRFVSPHVVELSYRLTNLGDVAHRATTQELPTVYTSNGRSGPDLWRFFTSDGVQREITTPANDGFFVLNADSPGGWVTLQNDDATYGVGMYYENHLTGFQAWQNRSLPFNNFRSRFSFGIPARGTVSARAYLILGSLDTVRSEAERLERTLAPFGPLDTPAADATVSGTTTIGGWALDNRGVDRVWLRVDGEDAIDLTYGRPRPDVCAAWPSYANCPNVGYDGSFDFSSLSPCQHLLEVVAADTHGNERVIARRRVTVE